MSIRLPGYPQELVSNESFPLPHTPENGRAARQPRYRQPSRCPRLSPLTTGSGSEEERRRVTERFPGGGRARPRCKQPKASVGSQATRLAAPGLLARPGATAECKAASWLLRVRLQPPQPDFPPRGELDAPKEAEKRFFLSRARNQANGDRFPGGRSAHGVSWTDIGPTDPDV